MLSLMALFITLQAPKEGKGGRKRGHSSPSIGKSEEKITKRAQTQKGEREKRVMND